MDGLDWATLLTSRTKQVAIKGVLDYAASSVVDDPFQRAEVYLLHASPSNIPGNSRLQYAYEKPPDSSYMTTQEIEEELRALIAVFKDLGSMQNEMSRDPLLKGVSLSSVKVMSGAVFNVPEASPTAAPGTTNEPTTEDVVAIEAIDTQANAGQTTTIVVVVILSIVVFGLGFLYRRRKMQQGEVEFSGSSARVVVNAAYSPAPVAGARQQQQGSGGKRSEQRESTNTTQM